MIGNWAPVVAAVGAEHEPHDFKDVDIFEAYGNMLSCKATCSPHAAGPSEAKA